MSPVVRTTSVRILFDLILFFIICTQWWWLGVLLALVGTFYFKNFYELIVVGVIIDLLFGVPRIRFYGFEWYGTIISVILFAILRFIKLHLRHSFA